MSIFFPSRLNFGADIQNIQFTNNKVIKQFKNINSFQKTIDFYKFIDNENMFPKLFSHNNETFTIETEDCGVLLNLYNLPKDWEKQINNFRKFFLKNGILILDFRFMPHTPLVINNLCIKNNTIYLVDLALYDVKNNNYINKYFDKIIHQIKLYLKYKNQPFILFPLHFCFEIKRLLSDLFEKLL